MNQPTPNFRKPAVILGRHCGGVFIVGFYWSRSIGAGGWRTGLCGVLLVGVAIASVAEAFRVSGSAT